MSTADTTTEAVCQHSPTAAPTPGGTTLPISRPALGPARNKRGTTPVASSRNLYRVTDATYQSVFLTTSDGDARDGETQRRQP